MRLLFLTENYPPDRGGMAESCDRIVRGLRAAGVEIDLVHFDRRAAREAFHLTTAGSRLRWPVEADAAHTINCLWNRMGQHLDLRKTTHVVAFGGFLPLLSAPAFAAWIDRPLVTMLRGNELDAGLFDPRKRPILDDALLRSATVCTLTRAHASKVSSLYRDVVPHVIANGIDFELWSATEADRARGQRWREANVEPQRRVIGLFGDLKAKKGSLFFLQSLLRSGFAEAFHLLFIGEMEQGLRERLEGESGVAFTQMAATDRLDLLPYYTAADLIALPSHYDGFPNVLIEALALGRPLLASRTGGMADVLTEGETAFLFEPGDEEGCRAALRRAAEVDAITLQKMGERGERVARERCDAKSETERYLEVLQSHSHVILAAVDES
jgi:glycosyltransferase involved in cell wall biosynthesis